MAQGEYLSVKWDTSKSEADNAAKTGPMVTGKPCELVCPSGEPDSYESTVQTYGHLSEQTFSFNPNSGETVRTIRFNKIKTI